MVERTAPENLDGLVFKCILTKDLGEFSLDGRMLSILMALDGQRDLAAVSRKLGMDLESIKRPLNSLLRQGIIELQHQESTKIEKAFIVFLYQQLSLAVGPIARILIEDAVQDLGQTLDRFPRHLIAELVDLLARQIRREDKGTLFRRKMLKKIKEMSL